MSELDKLEQYLQEHGDKYTREDVEGEPDHNAPPPHWSVHQIVVYNAKGTRKWDAICQRGSYGYEDGLLEIYGDIVDYDKDGDSVVGWLTAEDVIKRVRGKR